MKKNNICSIIIFIGVVTVAHSQWSSRHPKNSFEIVTVEDSYSVINQDTIKFNELKFSGLYDRHYIQKGMHDKFGKWSKHSYSKQKDTLLIWNDVKLFENKNDLYKVAIKASRTGSNTYSSVFVFDKYNNDQLSIGSAIKKDLIKIFSGYIRKNDNNKVEFYIDFLEMIGKKKYMYIKENLNKYKRIKERSEKKNKNQKYN